MHYFQICFFVAVHLISLSCFVWKAFIKLGCCFLQNTSTFVFTRLFFRHFSVLSSFHRGSLKAQTHNQLWIQRKSQFRKTPKKVSYSDIFETFRQIFSKKGFSPYTCKCLQENRTFNHQACPKKAWENFSSSIQEWSIIPFELAFFQMSHAWNTKIHSEQFYSNIIAKLDITHLKPF